jgi:hypothetical protein
VKRDRVSQVRVTGEPAFFSKMRIFFFNCLHYWMDFLLQDPVEPLVPSTQRPIATLPFSHTRSPLPFSQPCPRALVSFRSTNSGFEYSLAITIFGTLNYYLNIGCRFPCHQILPETGITIRGTGVPWRGPRFEMEVPKDLYRFSEERGYLRCGLPGNLHFFFKKEDLFLLPEVS